MSNATLSKAAGVDALGAEAVSDTGFLFSQID